MLKAAALAQVPRARGAAGDPGPAPLVRLCAAARCPATVRPELVPTGRADAEKGTAVADVTIYHNPH